jgi:hypothetical protein
VQLTPGMCIDDVFRRIQFPPRGESATWTYNAVTGCAVKGGGPQRGIPARELVRSTR